MNRHEAFHGKNINVGIQHHVFHMFFTEKLSPVSQAEAVMEHDGLIFREDFPKAPIGIPVEVFQKRKGNIAGAFGFFFVHCFPGRRRCRIHKKADWLIKNFNSI